MKLHFLVAILVICSCRHRELDSELAVLEDTFLASKTSLDSMVSSGIVVNRQDALWSVSSISKNGVTIDNPDNIDLILLNRCLAAYHKSKSGLFALKCRNQPHDLVYQIPLHTTIYDANSKPAANVKFMVIREKDGRLFIKSKSDIDGSIFYFDDDYSCLLDTGRIEQFKLIVLYHNRTIELPFFIRLRDAQHAENVNIADPIYPGSN